MNAYEDFNEKRRKESPEETVKRLRAEIAAGEVHLRPELAESLMRSAQHLTEKQSFDGAVILVDEAISIAGQLIKDGQIEFRESMGRCMLFRAVILRLAQGSNAGLAAFNDVIHFITEKKNGSGSGLQNELAVALMNRAEIQINPVGALSAAIASQEQAIKIWTRLAENGEPEFRHQLIAALLSSAEATEQSGDSEKAAANYQKAIEYVQLCLEDGETAFVAVLLQALMKLAQLLERREDFQDALDVSGRAVELVMQIAEDGSSAPKVLLPVLYLQRGLIYERIREPEAALAEFDRCGDVYRRAEEQGQLDYASWVGKANVMMCRGNVLADLKRFEEASDAFNLSESLYEAAEDLRPRDDEDKTFLLYSKGVVQLNHANMLVALGKPDEAVTLKTQALKHLRKRFDSGHTEILPNIITAYRKMIGIQRMKNNRKQTLLWINELAALLEPVVDDGQLEYISDLAAVYELRSICLEEQGEWDAAEKDLLHSLRLYRTAADDETDEKFPAAKLQWGELLEHAAFFYAHQNKIEKSFQLFQRAINEVQRCFAEGNPQLIFDILHGYSQFLGFTEKQLQKEERYPDKLVQKLVRIAQKAADSGIETAQQHRMESDDLSAAMFFDVKAASFFQQRGALSMLVKKYKNAGKDFSSAVKLWEQLDTETDKLRLKAEYYRREAGGNGESIVKFGTNDPFRDRQIYYIKERIETLQRQAECALALKQFVQAEQLFEQKIAAVRFLISSNVREAQRMLIFSLSLYVKSTDGIFPYEKVDALYRETLQQIDLLFQEEETPADEDYLMLRHIYTSFALFLLKHNQDERASELFRQYVQRLADCENYPPPEIWVELCRTLDIFAFWQTGSPSKNNVRDLQRELLISHPITDAEPIRQFHKELGAETAQKKKKKSS